MRIGLNFCLRLTLVALILVMASCSGVRHGMVPLRSVNDPVVMDYTCPSPNYNERQSKVMDIVVMHYTVDNLENALKTLTNSTPVGRGRVSAHYLVPKANIDGHRKVFALVPENKRAWHAGVGQWSSCNDVNTASIGIEIVNAGWRNEPSPGHWENWDPFTDYQMDTLISLTQPIVQRYNIKPTHVIGHADLAPGRKQDPGPVFPWEKLYKNGIGAWYNRSELDIKEQGSVAIEQLQEDLQIYGYPVHITGDLEDGYTRNVLQSFQMHFRPKDYSGNPDAETAAIAKNLVEKYYNDSRK